MPQRMPSRRVARTIGRIKWCLVVVIEVTATAVATALAYFGPGSTELGHGTSGLAALAVLLAGAVAGLVTWVVLGWSQHVLSALLDIADGTGGPPAPVGY